jgi:hypothetical protein
MNNNVSTLAPESNTSKLLVAAPKLRSSLKAVGVFVPWHAKPRGRQSANVGWITDANGCDIWQGNRTTDGYGRVWVDGRDHYVTRVRYEREIGPIPEGMEPDHYICDNGAGGCCNPFHCRPVTRRENVLRGNSPAAAHAAKTHCPKGHPLSGGNLDKHRLARGQRICRTCRNAGQRATYRLKRKAA